MAPKNKMDLLNTEGVIAFLGILIFSWLYLSDEFFGDFACFYQF